MSWVLQLLARLGPGLLGSLRAFIPSAGTAYLILALCASSAAAGGWAVYKFWQASEVEAVNDARHQERTAAAVGLAHEKLALLRAEERQETAREKIEALERRLARVKPCPVAVPADWLRDHRPVPRAAADPAGARPADPPLDPAPAGPTADARDAVLTCERNRLEVYQAEADERQQLRDWYRDLCRERNKDPTTCG